MVIDAYDRPVLPDDIPNRVFNKINNAPWAGMLHNDFNTYFFLIFTWLYKECGISYSAYANLCKAVNMFFKLQSPNNIKRVIQKISVYDLKIILYYINKDIKISSILVIPYSIQDRIDVFFALYKRFKYNIKYNEVNNTLFKKLFPEVIDRFFYARTISISKCCGKLMISKSIETSSTSYSVKKKKVGQTQKKDKCNELFRGINGVQNTINQYVRLKTNISNDQTILQCNDDSDNKLLNRNIININIITSHVKYKIKNNKSLICRICIYCGNIMLVDLPKPFYLCKKCYEEIADITPNLDTYNFMFNEQNSRIIIY